MNPQDTTSSVSEEAIDLLVAGELAEERRGALLAALGEEAGGWKRCAQAFLEMQTWREAMVGPLPVENVSRRRWLLPVTSVAAAVLGFLVAVVGWPGAERPSPAELVAGGVEPEVRVVPYPVVEHTGFVRASDERGNLFYQTRGDIPDFFLEALREAGHDVKYVERVVDLPLEDGAPMQLPITETRVFVNHEL